MGWHLSLGFLDTYKSIPVWRDFFPLLTNDPGIPFLTLVLIIIIIVLASVFYKRIHRWVTPRQRTVVISVLVLLFCSWLYRDVLWKGGFREKRLKPVVKVLYEQLIEEKFEFDSLRISQISQNLQKMWNKKQLDSLWVFPTLKQPTVRIPRQQYCESQWSPRCDLDADQDGFSLKEDCNDWDSKINPKMFDIPSNGVDEDCNGIDEKPWNVVVFFLESHRALNAGFLKSYGSMYNGTPFLNKIAPQSTFWTRFSTSGVPTIGAFMSLHLGFWDHPYDFVSTRFPTLKSMSFVNILNQKNYDTHFFSSSDPAWDNKTPWLKQWYGRYHYNRFRENDHDMLQHMGNFLADSIQEPFFATAITKVNHYPFNLVQGMKPHKPNATLVERMENSMSFTEESIEKMIRKIKNKPWFERTIFVFLADHGYHLGEKNVGGTGSPLYTTLTWIPLLMWGKHPELNYKPRKNPASQLDIGATIFDLLGIQEKFSSIGHSLVTENEKSNSYLFSDGSIVFEEDSLRIHCNFEEQGSSVNIEVYDINDRLERTDIYSSNKSLAKSICTTAKQYDSLNVYIYESNQLWD